jgi:CRP-like cAMP-binding protein
MSSPAPSPALSDLLQTTPFAHMGPEATRSLTALFRTRRADKGKVVFLEGDTGGSFFVVSGGRLKAFRRLPNGREITVFLLGSRDCFGFLPLLDGGPYPLSVEALEPSVFHVLERPAFLRFTKENNEFCTLLMAHLAQRLRGCIDQIGLMGQQGAFERVAQGLLSLLPPSERSRGGAAVVLPFTQEEFARTLHLAPENLSRALAKLRRQGFIERAGKGRFRIVDPESLGRILGE